ncbi:STAS domain-containing protein [Priestia koreensis]|uniref:STAS domain-containing protein n=1 Tax=Priestia koreensis TaxID=284581 RepID=UPI001F57725D|nr:STAS domain-containing protein [Priestia koreensis]UNL85741.1 STAS domain-containing protein [Priestia koreensis]
MNVEQEKYSIKIKESTFDWDLEEGTFKFEGDEVVLFWVNTAFKTFFDAIEEVSGSKAASIVLETAGYRTGEIVSAFYQKSMGDFEQILSTLPNTYLTAGWGKTSINIVSKDEKRAVVRIQDSWEYKVTMAQGKGKEGTFLPGHWAGVFSGLYGTSMWYQVNKSQVKGDPYTEFEFFPSSITPQKNIHSLVNEQRQAEIEASEKYVVERTEQLSKIIKEISSPIIPVLENIVVIPLLGEYDESRAEELLSKTLFHLPEYKANYLLLDLTGISGVNEFTIDLLQKLVRSTSLLGTEAILVGISPELSMKMTSAGFLLSNIPCFSTLQHGIHHALSEEGLHIVKKS